MVSAPAGKGESSRMCQEPDPRPQTRGPGDTRLQAPFETWGGDRIRGTVCARGPGPCLSCHGGRVPAGGVRAAGAAALLCRCAFCRALRAASAASQMSSLFSQNGRTFQVGGTLALHAGAGLQLGLLKLVQPLRLLPQLCLVASEHHGNPMQRRVASGKPSVRTLP